MLAACHRKRKRSVQTFAYVTHDFFPDYSGSYLLTLLFVLAVSLTQKAVSPELDHLSTRLAKSSVFTTIIIIIIMVYFRHRT